MASCCNWRCYQKVNTAGKTVRLGSFETLQPSNLFSKTSLGEHGLQRHHHSLLIKGHFFIQYVPGMKTYHLVAHNFSVPGEIKFFSEMRQLTARFLQLILHTPYCKPYYSLTRGRGHLPCTLNLFQSPMVQSEKDSHSQRQSKTSVNQTQPTFLKVFDSHSPATSVASNTVPTPRSHDPALRV